MPRLNFFRPAALLAVVVLFFYGLIHILLLRYERGDLYPAYSTFRSDPLGTRAFYEALDATGAYRVSRGFISLHRELEQEPTTLFFLGLAPDDLKSFASTDIAELDDYVKKGGRVIIALEPSPAENKKAETPPKPADKPPAGSSPEPAGAPKTEQEKFERDQFKKDEESGDKPDQKGSFPAKFEPSLQARWGFGWTFHGADDEKASAQASSGFSEKGDVLAIRATPDGPETKVPWKSAGYFLRLEPAWVVQYTARDKPVFIERPWGKGSILVSSDSYFFSNEALRDDRKPRLLSLVTGAGGHLLFDEVHLGTEEKEGVMALAQRFRLEGYLYGMLIVTALFLWRNSVPLVPPAAALNASLLGGAVSGKDSRNGLVNLLRRNISQRELLKTCLAEWKRTVAPRRNSLDSKAAAMETALASADTSGPSQIVQTYHQLRELNTGGRQKESYARRN